MQKDLKKVSKDYFRIILKLRKENKIMTQNQSPLPQEIQHDKKEELFDFSTAMKQVAEGKKISRKEWNNVNIYGRIKDEKLMLHKEDNIDYAWIVSTGDLTGRDWFVIQ